MTEVTAKEIVEQVEGMVGCYNCGYQGTMTGYIKPEKRTVINFVCPQCEVVERVDNPFV